MYAARKTSFPPLPHSLTSGGAGAASSTARRARRSSACATACVTAASPPRATTRASQMRSGSRIRTIFSLTARPSWSRRTPSAWASTSQTSALSSITTCRKVSRPTIRRRAAPDATARMPTASCSSRPPMWRPHAFSSKTAGPTSSRRRTPRSCANATMSACRR